MEKRVVAGIVAPTPHHRRISQLIRGYIFHLKALILTIGASFMKKGPRCDCLKKFLRSNVVFECRRFLFRFL
jgi:hypothetical protein